ncbi:3-hydroxybutyryl-CoA dehydrogenase [Stella humosa]|uniref:3-hydroxybutyryl-CoA dehydrogenase n=1 Tax=Stella humosa TaxID=94 RepID=A0A3N1M9E5_9PROT|nr:3-hydroxyacyl-CoA dehydrogenase [Stella humosa]ROQ00303.1 3-hydroxybutyryl-CoA dehydrogenase [Stella humosa]BBK30459.1 3-hydroxyacyl-CoA dehydrogenase [Stella humosa]
MNDAIVVGVVGAGTMGAGIAQVAATGGHAVLLYDAAPGFAAKSLAAIAGRIDRLAEKGTLTAESAAAAKGRITVVDDLSQMAPAGVVIEAVVEDLAVKHAVFTTLEAHCAPDAILASNTSSIPIARIAQALKHRGRVAGLHFFNPVPVMRLVEVISGPDTDPAVADRLSTLGERFGRVPVKVKDAPGFLVNFGGRSFTTEGLALVHEGVATPEQVDQVMRDCCHFRMGPFELMDLTGIDVNHPVSEIIWQGYYNDPRLRTTPYHRSMREAGRLGRKTGQGHFTYDAKGVRTPGLVPSLPESAPAERVVLLDVSAALSDLMAGADQIAHDDGESPLLVAPVGEDCTAVAVRLGVDHRRLVAVDLVCDISKRVTLMTAPGADPAVLAAVAARIVANGRAVTAIKDSPGFIQQRLRAMIANLGCEMAQIGVAAPADIDTAMQLGLNYPQGPLAMTDQIGASQVHAILQAIQAATGDDRYRPSLWLRRRALLGLPAATPA